MTSTIAYGMSDLAPTPDGRVGPGTVNVPPDRGGCGDSHTVSIDDTGHPVVRCPACVPILIGGAYGWAATPAGVPLTPDEHSEVEIAEREGQLMQKAAMRTFSTKLAEMVQAPKQVEAPVLSASTIAAQLAALPASERAELLKALSGPSETPVAEDKPAGTAPAVAAPARKPGRPRSRPL